MGAIDEDVRRHKHGVGEQPDAGFDALFDFLLVRDGPFQQTHVGYRAEDPGQLGDFRHVRLAEKVALAGSSPRRQVIQGDIHGSFAERGGVLGGRQGMVIGNEIKALALVLQGDVLLDCAEIIAQVQFARRLDAAEYAKWSLVLGPLSLAGRWLLVVHDGCPTYNRQRFCEASLK